MATLNETWVLLAEKAYAQATTDSDGAPTDSAAPDANDDDDVIDAEFDAQ